MKRKLIFQTILGANMFVPSYWYQWPADHLPADVPKNAMRQGQQGQQMETRPSVAQGWTVIHSLHAVAKNHSSTHHHYKNIYIYVCV